MIFVMPSPFPFSMVVPRQMGRRRLEMVVLVVVAVMVAGVELAYFLHILHLS
jgi:heme/copper-type cytochrome/quinol oxidase subunit 4